jgi:hypothetical protein
MSMKNTNDPIENQTCDLLACSAVPKPTAPPEDYEGSPYIHMDMVSVMMFEMRQSQLYTHGY